MVRNNGENRLADISAKLGQTHVGEFQPLIPRCDVGDGGEKVSSPTQRKALQFESNMLTELRKARPNMERLPYSYLSCVLSLPTSLEEWGDNEQILFLYLASDHGFTFRESRPVTSGAFKISALVSTLEPWQNDEPEINMGITLQKIRRPESYYVSEASRLFENMYRHENDEPTGCPKILRALIDCSEIPDLFRKLVLLQFTGAGLNKEHLQSLEEDAGRMNRVYFRELPNCNAVLEEDAKNRGVSVERNSLNEPVAFTLQQAIENLNKICDDLLKERKEAEARMASLTISHDAAQRLQNQKTVLKRLEDFFSCIPEITFDLEERIRYQQRHPDGIQGYNADDLIRAIVLNEVHKSSPNVVLNNVPAQKAILPELEESVTYIFIQYYGSVKSKVSLCEVIRFALWSEMAVLDDDEEGDISVSYAPVITYLLFKRYHKKIKASNLMKISLKAVFGGYQQSSMSEETAIRDFRIYSDLCKAYQRHYDKRYTTGIQAAWDMAFLRYSGYSRIFEHPDLLRAVRREAPLLVFKGTNAIDVAVEINRNVDLSHSYVSPKNHILDRFHPICRADKGWDAVQFFKRCLLQEEKANGDNSCIARYLELIQQPYGIESIREFLECIICYLSAGKYDEHKFADRIMICNQCMNRDNRLKHESYQRMFSRLRLNDVFCGGEQRKSFQQDEIFAALEYTLRLIASERCVRRLYHWYYALLCEATFDERHEKS